MRHPSVLLVAAVALTALPAAARAGGTPTFEWKGAVLRSDLFGNLLNTAEGLCAATSTMNSFQYLAKKYPARYRDTKLLKGTLAETATLEDARNLLHRGGWAAGRAAIPTCVGRSNAKEWWEAKTHWIEDFAPRTTEVSGMVAELDPRAWFLGGNVKKGAPTFTFLFDAILKQKDIEIAYYLDDGGANEGHAVTLIGLRFKDKFQTGTGSDGKPKPGNGRWDSATEEAELTFIDSNKPVGSQVQVVKMLPPANSRLRFEYDGKQRRIDLGYTEGPCSAPRRSGSGNLAPLAEDPFTCAFAAVPEPSTTALTVGGLVLLVAAGALRRRALTS